MQYRTRWFILRMMPALVDSPSLPIPMPGPLILIAYHYPPENAVGALRPARFARYLPDLGWPCEVFTAAPQENFSNPAAQYVEDRTRPLWEGGLKSGNSVSATQKYTELAIRKFIFRGALGLSWASEVPDRVAAQTSTNSSRPKAVLSTFPPLSAHLAGWRTARKLRIPWIADYRDPFAPAPDFQANGRARLVSRWLESRFFADAAAVIVNTEAAAAMYRDRYPVHSAKIHVIWNGFDPAENLGPLPIPKRPRRSLLHAGALYAGRNPVAILESFQRLKESGTGEVESWEVALVGPNDSSPEEHLAIEQAVATGIASLEPKKIPQAEARRRTQEADGLLLLQPQSSVQVPGKLFEYIRIGRPILSFSPRKSAIEWILERCGSPFVNVYPDDPPAEVDRKVLAFLALPSDPVEPSSWFVENFNAEFQARQLAEILDRVTGGEQR